MGLEDEGPYLVGLEALQRLGGALQALEGAGALVGGFELAGLLAVEVGLGRADDPQPGRPDGHRLVLDHGPQPRGGARRVEAVGVAEEDLQGALVGVLGVVGAQRVAPRGGQKRGGVLGDGLDHQLGAGRAARGGG